MDIITKKTLALKKLHPNYISSLGDRHYNTDGEELVINQSNLDSKIAEVDLDELMFDIEEPDDLVGQEWWYVVQRYCNPS